MKTEMKTPKEFLAQVGNLGWGAAAGILVVTFIFLGVFGGRTVFWKIPSPPGWLVFLLLVSAVVTGVLYLFLCDLMDRDRRVYILTAIVKYPDRTELTEAFIWAENKGWPVIDVLEPVQYQFTLQVYHKHLQIMAAEIARDLAPLRPGKAYDLVQEKLYAIHATKSWKKMSNEDCIVEPTHRSISTGG